MFRARSPSEGCAGTIQVKTWTTSVTSIALARDSKTWFRESYSVRAAILSHLFTTKSLEKVAYPHAFSTPSPPSRSQPPIADLSCTLLWRSHTSHGANEATLPLRNTFSLFFFYWKCWCICYYWSSPTWNSLLQPLWTLLVPDFPSTSSATLSPSVL